MRDTQIKKIGSWRFAAGRIRAEETRLLDLATIRGLASLRSEEELRNVMREHGYKDAPTVSAMLALEETSIWDLAHHVAYDRRYLRMFALRNDGHNLKVVLRTFAKHWLDSAGEASVHFEVNFADVAEQFVSPTSFEPKTLFAAVKVGDFGTIAEPYRTLVRQALDAFAQTTAMATIDAFIDREVEKLLANETATLNNEWLASLLQQQRDQKNLEILLRGRSIAAPRVFLAGQMLPEGKIALKDLLSWYELDHDALQKKLELSSFNREVIDAAKGYDEVNGAAKFGVASDNAEMVFIRKARQILAGPEVLLAYILARYAEIKNLRYALTALENKMSQDLILPLLRRPYIEKGA